jgi:DNA helicase-2/ATP-dependent DNA helicase PcrA
MDFLKGLNAQQREAVMHTEGPLLILAGAGSGKTRVITHRVAYIVTARRVPPSAVLAVTFTNKAATKCGARGSALLEDANLDSTPNISTFHSFCVRMLRRDGDPLVRIRPGFTRRFSIYDDEDQLAIVKATYRGAGPGRERVHAVPRGARPASATPRTGRRRRRTFYKQRGQQGNRDAGRCSRNTKRRCTRPTPWISTTCCSKPSACSPRRRHARSLEPPAELRHDRRVPGHQPQPVRVDAPAFGSSTATCAWWGTRTSRSIAGAARTSATFSISSAIFPKARTIRLEQNYRSTKNILAAAGAVVENNKARKGKKLWTEGAEGEHVGLYAAFDAENEALFIADTTEKHLAGNPGDRVASSTAPMPSRGGSKRPCGATGASTTSWAASVSTSARKSRTRWRI